MRTFSHPRLDAWHRTVPRAPLVERLLRSIGAERAFVDDVLGDLVQERARRAADEGAAAARLWYLREALRSAPHLVRNAVAHGGPHARMRIAMAGAAVVMLPLVALAAMTLMPGPAVRLAATGPSGVERGANGVIINTLHPVRLAVQAFDARGHRLSSVDARYRWIGGDSLAVSALGIAACKRDSDALVRATLGTLSTVIRLGCRPVEYVTSELALTLLADETPHELRWRAYGPNGARVEQLTGRLRVADSTVATLRGNVVRPVAPGRTQISIEVGDAEGTTEVDVYERVPSFRGLRRNQMYVAAAVLLAPDSAVSWPLPKGEFWLRYSRSASTDSMPAATVVGRVVCVPEPSMTYTMTVRHCAARDARGSIRLRNLTSSTPINGMLYLERRNDFP
jgi:hypothetical protein